MHPRPSGLITLTTDFGLGDPYVALVHGAIAKVSDKPRVLDLSHAVAPQDIAAGAFVLWTAIGRFPAGTVHVGVVDPGVGSDRRLLAASAHGQFWIAPDNGLLGAVLGAAPDAEVRELDLEHLRIEREAVTFDGRDVFGPAAALLACGRYSFPALGARVTDAAGDDPVFGGQPRIVHVDRFGNLISNVPAERLGGATTVRIADRNVPLRRTYGDVPVADLLAYVGSFGLVEVAARDGSAAHTLGIGAGAAIALDNA